MIGIDTNLLVRYITQDGPAASVTTRHLERECTLAQPGFICLIVLCELVWVLARAYRYDRQTIAAILGRLLTTAEFEVEQAALAWQALDEYRVGPADFSDYLIGQVARTHDAAPVHTLDRNAAKGPNFILLDARRDRHPTPGH